MICYKKYFILFILLTLSISIGYAFDKEDIPVFQLDVMSEIDVEADYAVIVFDITKKNRSFEKASDECTAVLKKIIDEALSGGIQQKDIKKNKFNGYPDSGLFNKEYAVSSQLEMNIYQPELLSTVVNSILQIDTDITLSKLYFDYEKEKEMEIKKELIDEAAKEADILKKHYEKAFNVKLKIYNMTCYDSLYESMYIPEGPPGFDDNRPTGYKELYSSENLPEKKFSCWLTVIYQVINN